MKKPFPFDVHAIYGTFLQDCDSCQIAVIMVDLDLIGEARCSPLGKSSEVICARYKNSPEHLLLYLQVTE